MLWLQHCDMFSLDSAYPKVISGIKEEIFVFDMNDRNLNWRAYLYEYQYLSMNIRSILIIFVDKYESL